MINYWKNQLPLRKRISKRQKIKKEKEKEKINKNNSVSSMKILSTELITLIYQWKKE